MTMLKVWDGTQWLTTAGVKGDKGEQGDQGIQGPPGSDADVTAHEAAADPHPQYVQESDIVASAVPIGGYVIVQANIPGSVGPPSSNYIRLLAGAGYNTGKLTSESVTGTHPLINATAVISDAGSPMNGQTVRLLETERRFMRPGSIGTVENDMMQTITGSFVVRGDMTLGGQLPSGAFALGTPYAGLGAASANSDTRVNFNSSNSPGARTGSETRPRNIGVAVYMRIK